MWIFWVFKGIFMIHKSFFLCEVRMGLCLSLRFVTHIFKGCELYCSFEVTACSQPACMTGHLTVTLQLSHLCFQLIYHIQCTKYVNFNKNDFILSCYFQPHLCT